MGTVDFPPGSYVKISRYLPKSFPLPVMFKKYRYFIKHTVTMATIQSTREAHITI